MKSICTNRTQIEDWILEKVWYCDNVREGGREGERIQRERIQGGERERIQGGDRERIQGEGGR